MKFATTALNIFSALGFANAALRGDGNPSRRRHLAPGTECVTYLKIFMDDDEKQTQTWSCEFSDEDAVGAQRMTKIEGLTLADFKDKHAISGGTVLKVGASSYVETTDTGNVLHVDAKDSFVIEEMDDEIDVRHYKYRRRERRRRLADSTGPLNTLVMRLIDSEGVAPPDTAALENDIFTDEACLKSTFEECSYGAVTIQQAQNTGFSTTINGVEYNGIIDVQMPSKVSDETDDEDFWNAAVEIVEADKGVNLRANFDLVMFCYPSGIMSGIAYAYVNHHVSVYNNDWCGYVSAQMHEVGHNVGLAHSGENGDEYGDQTGAMAYGFSKDDTPLVCFNSAKTYQLGWYTNHVTSINPLNLPGGVKSYTLNGVVDYGRGGFVSIRLEDTGAQNQGKDYYIGYNRATSFNVGTGEAPDEVHIVEKINEWNDREGYGQSWLLATLTAGQSHTLEIDGTDVTIEVDSIIGADAVITITGDGPSVPSPTTAPVAPVASPTTAPVAPVASPTVAPVAPVASPTTAPVAPVASPTTAPVAPVASPTTAPVAPIPDPTTAPVPSPTRAPVPDQTTAPVPDQTTAPVSSPTPKPTKSAKKTKAPKRKLRSN